MGFLLPLRAAGACLIALAVVSLLVLDPAQTVTPDLARLYGEMGFVAIPFFGIALGWVALVGWGFWRLSQRIVDTTRDQPRLQRWAGRLPLSLLLLGAIPVSSLVPGFFLLIGAYMVAEDGGFAPRSGSLSEVVAVQWWAGFVLMLLGGVGAAGVGAVRTLRRRRERSR